MTRQRALLRPLALVVLGLAALAGARAESKNEAAEARMRRDITFIASDECEGRGVTTRGIEKAAAYIVEQFKVAGLKPGGVEGTYFQPFPIRGGVRLEQPNEVVLHGPQGQAIRLKQGEQFQVSGLSGPGKVTAPVVFAGYGATAKGIGYDDFAGVDVAGKVVILVRKTPRPDSRYAPFDGSSAAYHAGLVNKFANAEAHKAAAVVLVNDRDTASREDRLLDFSYATSEGANKVPAIHVRRAVVDEMLRSSTGKSLREWEEDIDRELKPHSVATAWTATVETAVRRNDVTAKNIIGVVEGSGPLANETVVVGAHYDHLGYGEFGSLAPRTQQGKAIHHGADDNGSGTTAVMELARRFGGRKGEARRRLVFMTFSGEERGLLGSAYYVNHPLFPLENTVAMVNLDMVGRLSHDPATKKDKLLIEGSGSAKSFDTLLDQWAAKYGFQMSKKASGFGPSDHASFYGKRVPVIFYWTGLHNDYHRPSDTADKINVVGMAKVVALAEETIDYLSKVEKRPEYVRVGETPSPTIGRARGPRIGIRPAYDDDKEGVLLSGVSENTPASRGGLKEADRIVEVNGKPVRSLEGYMALVAGLKPGEQVDMTVIRAGKRTPVKLKLD